MNRLPVLRTHQISQHTRWLLLGVTLSVLSLCGCHRDNAGLTQIDAVVMESYVGQYRPDPKTEVEIKRSGAHLEMTVNHQQPSLVFLPESADGFIHRESSTRIRFVKDDSGKVISLALIRDGRTNEAARVAATAAAAPNPVAAVVVGASSFHFLKRGGTHPTVILCGDIGAWNSVQPAVAEFAAVVSFDRKAATGNGSAPVPTTPGEAAGQLHAALAQAGFVPPYVMVGHSFGGLVARVFASHHPQEVAGLVLVDPLQEGFLDWLKAHQPENHDKLMAPLRDRYATNWEKSLAELRAASAFPQLPTVVLSAAHRRRQSGNELERNLTDEALAEGSAAVVAAHRKWLGAVPRGRQIIVEDSSHDIPHDRPEAVVEAIRQIVEQARGVKTDQDLKRNAP
jgi:pimeloyl-ACP methyl ester carboxylesterase